MMQSPPQPGEVWINIHTSQLANINAIEDVNVTADKTIRVVVFTDTKTFEGGRTNIDTFNAHWKRHKSASKWFVGALGTLGKPEEPKAKKRSAKK